MSEMKIVSLKTDKIIFLYSAPACFREYYFTVLPLNYTITISK